MTQKKGAGSWKPKFLEALAGTGNVSDACRAADVSRKTAYQWKDRDSAFAELWDDALDEGADALEAAARSRAVHGVDRERWVRTGSDAEGRPTFKQIIEKEYSDVLIMFLLKGIRPEVYRENYDLNKLVAAIASAQENPANGQQKAAKASGRKRSA